MGLKTIKIGAREAVELACDYFAHRGEPSTALFDCGCDLGNLSLAMVTGWERRKASRMWLRPRCAQQDLKRTARAIVPTKRPAATAPPDPTANERFARPPSAL
jgi:hypothetical protein